MEIPETLTRSVSSCGISFMARDPLIARAERAAPARRGRLVPRAKADPNKVSEREGKRKVVPVVPGQ